MTNRTATRILDLHSVEHRQVDGSLEVLEVSSLHGSRVEEWITCPATRFELLCWLGY